MKVMEKIQTNFSQMKTIISESKIILNGIMEDQILKKED